jgi:hypothetical protein
MCGLDVFKLHCACADAHRPGQNNGHSHHYARCQLLTAVLLKIWRFISALLVRDVSRERSTLIFTMVFRNVGNQVPNNTASNPRRLQFSLHGNSEIFLNEYYRSFSWKPTRSKGQADSRLISQDVTRLEVHIDIHKTADRIWHWLLSYSGWISQHSRNVFL